MANIRQILVNIRVVLIKLIFEMLVPPISLMIISLRPKAKRPMGTTTVQWVQISAK